MLHLFHRVLYKTFIFLCWIRDRLRGRARKGNGLRPNYWGTETWNSRVHYSAWIVKISLDLVSMYKMILAHRHTLTGAVWEPPSPNLITLATFTAMKHHMKTKIIYFMSHIKQPIYHTFESSVAAKWFTMVHIRKVQVSNISPGTGYPEDFCCFPLSLQASVSIGP